MSTYILDTETTGLIEPHMTEAAYSIIDISDSNVTVSQELRTKLSISQQFPFRDVVFQ
ncbi:hypothetical protein [Psychrobacter sp. AOP31-E1-50]|uniref:hypothetical protein n=1 Tax=Psychrobacter sp. AOP31-E1-50 TaxID=3457692 RepID=UPI0040353748